MNLFHYVSNKSPASAGSLKTHAYLVPIRDSMQESIGGRSPQNRAKFFMFWVLGVLSLVILFAMLQSFLVCSVKKNRAF